MRCLLLILLAIVGSVYSRPIVVAHRGYSAAAPENTLPAFIMAKQNGADGFETDLRFTKDGQIVCLHDDTLNRTTNCTGYLSNYTYAELADCDASYVDGADFSQFRGTKIPLFSEVVELARNLSMFVVMDYKSDTPLGPALANIVPNYTMTSQVFGSCWKPWQILDIEKYLPGAPKQMLTSGEDYNDPDFWQAVVMSGVNGFSIQLTNITSAFVQSAHARLLSVAVWTVNDPVLMADALSYDVDAILTDDLPVLFDVIRQQEACGSKKNYIGIHKWVLAVSIVVVFVVTAVATGLAVHYWRRHHQYVALESRLISRS